MNEAEYYAREEQQFYDYVQPFWGLPYSAELDDSTMLGLWRLEQRRRTVEEYLWYSQRRWERKSK